MLQRSTSAQNYMLRDYMLRVAADEIEFMEKEYLLKDYPHIVKFIKHPAGHFLLRHVQNFCWTVERSWRNLQAAIRRPPETVDSGVSTTLAVPTHLLKVARRRPDVWIDITNTYRSSFCGGIERAALKLANAAFETGLAVPVIIDDGEVYEYVGPTGRGARLRFTPDVVYVVADSFWQQVDEYSRVCDAARAAGAMVVLCIHDVIPLYHPSFNRSAFAQTFAHAFETMIERCDACIASSKYSREKVRAAIKARRLRVGNPLPLTYFHLGADGHVCVDLRQVRAAVRDLFARDRVFLGVGTLEPRKGYAVTLDAFDTLWERGLDCGFVIIGHPGWISKALEQRIVEHPRYGQDLYWIADASDAELTFAYRNAHCLVQASITEGFGLPIVEATLEGTPVIATDNEIFRELAGDEITYFRSCDSADLAVKIAAAISERPPAGRLHPLRWDESLAQMVARLADVLEMRQAA